MTLHLITIQLEAHSHQESYANGSCIQPDYQSHPSISLLTCDSYAHR